MSIIDSTRWFRGNFHAVVSSSYLSALVFFSFEHFSINFLVSPPLTSSPQDAKCPQKWHLSHQKLGPVASSVGTRHLGTQANECSASVILWSLSDVTRNEQLELQRIKCKRQREIARKIKFNEMIKSENRNERRTKNLRNKEYALLASKVQDAPIGWLNLKSTLSF